MTGASHSLMSLTIPAAGHTSENKTKLFLSWEFVVMNHTTRFSNSLVWERHPEKYALYVFLSVTLKKIVLLQFRWLIITQKRKLNKYLMMENENRDKQAIQIQGFLGREDKMVE